jgi:VanZ family protein
MKAIFFLSARIAAWLLAAIILILSVVPPWLRPETPAPHDLEHFAIFVAAGAAFGFGYNRRPIPLMAALVLFTGVIEAAQLFVPDRHARLSDFMVDALAACIGVTIALITNHTMLQQRT